MARLRTARLTNNDLLSPFATAVGELEQELCDIFGFTPDETITASALSLDNSGRVTKAELLRYFAEDTPSGTPLGNRGYGGGHVFTNSSASTSVMLSFEGLSGSPTLQVRSDSTLGIEPIQSGVPVFGINMSTGALSGSTTQNGVNKVLVPATAGAGSDSYYNAQGVFAVPGILPFAGVGAQWSNFVVPADDTMDLTYSSEDYDVGGYLASLSSHITIPTGGDGKYMVTMQSYMTFDGATPDITTTIIVNQTDLYSISHITNAGTPNYALTVNMAAMISLAATDEVDIEVTNDGTGAIATSGRVSVFRFA